MDFGGLRTLAIETQTTTRRHNDSSSVPLHKHNDAFSVGNFQNPYFNTTRKNSRDNFVHELNLKVCAVLYNLASREQTSKSGTITNEIERLSNNKDIKLQLGSVTT